MSVLTCSVSDAKGPRFGRFALVVVGLACVATVSGSAHVATFDLAGIVTMAGRPAQDAVVWLEAPDEAGPPSKPVVLDQRNLTFAPHVLAVRVGTIVEMPNSDRVFHNVFSFHDGKKFDLGLYPVGTRKRVHFDKPGLSRIFCNIHQGMAAYVKVVDSPYFAVSDGDGRFTIARVPQGSYTYHAWQAGKPDLTGTAEVGSERTLQIQWR